MKTTGSPWAGIWDGAWNTVWLACGRVVVGVLEGGFELSGLYQRNGFVSYSAMALVESSKGA